MDRKEHNRVPLNKNKRQFYSLGCVHKREELRKKNKGPLKDKEFNKGIDQVFDYVDNDTSSNRDESKSKASNLKTSVTHLDSHYLYT